MSFIGRTLRRLARAVDSFSEPVHPERTTTTVNAIVPLAHSEIVHVPQIKIEDVRNEAPRFERKYIASLINGITIEVRIYQWLGTNVSGMLTQPGGRYVFFEPERVADKILDPQLALHVQRCCNEILRADKAWRDSNPPEFTDTKGVTWRRVEVFYSRRLQA